MLPPCLSLEESFRKREREEKKPRVFYAELGCAAKHMYRPKPPPVWGSGCSALHGGAWGLGSRGQEERCAV